MRLENTSNFLINNSKFENNTAFLGGGLNVKRPEYG